jgi:ABC-type multidrug transport system permease subunit
MKLKDIADIVIAELLFFALAGFLVFEIHKRYFEFMNVFTIIVSSICILMLGIYLAITTAKQKRRDK